MSPEIPQGEQDRYGCTNFKELTGRQELNHQREDEHSLGDKRQVQAGAMLAHSVEPPLPGQEEDTGKAAVTADWERTSGKSGKQAGYLQQRLGGPLGLLLQCLLRLIKNFVFDSRRRHLQEQCNGTGGICSLSAEPRLDPRQERVCGRSRRLGHPRAVVGGGAGV